MTDTELRDQLMTLLLAGHETTATGLAWTFDLLLRHATTLQRLRDSLRRAPTRLHASDDLRVAAAATRGPACRPPPRQGPRGRWPLPAGGHRRHPGDLARPTPAPTSIREPFAFRPERFLDDAPDTYSWISFWRRHPPLLRRLLRRVRDADRAERGPHPLRPAQGQPDAGASRPPQHHLLAARRHARSSSPRAIRRVSRDSSPPRASSPRLRPGLGCSSAQHAIAPEPRSTPRRRPRRGGRLQFRVGQSSGSFTSARSRRARPRSRASAVAAATTFSLVLVAPPASSALPAFPQGWAPAGRGRLSARSCRQRANP